MSTPTADRPEDPPPNQPKVEIVDLTATDEPLTSSGLGSRRNSVGTSILASRRYSLGTSIAKTTRIGTGPRVQIAKRLIWLLTFVIVGGLVLLGTSRWTKVKADDVVRFLTPVFTAIVALVGSATTHYYGNGAGQGGKQAARGRRGGRRRKR